MSPKLPCWKVALSLGVAKLAYWATLLLALKCASLFGPDEYFEVVRRWPSDGPTSLASHLVTWDAVDYLRLSRDGYVKGMEQCAFYPLWPALLRGGSALTGGNDMLAALLLANAFSLVAWTLLWHHTAGRWGESVANDTLWFGLLYPGSLFFQFAYSESLFLLLIAVLWWALDGCRRAPAFLAGFLLPLARPVGVFGLLPILGQGHLRSPSTPPGLAVPASPKATSPPGVRAGADGRDAQVAAPAEARPGPRPTPLGWGPPVAPLLGWLAYLALMGYWTGDAFSAFGVQKEWGIHSPSHLWNLPLFLRELFSPTVWHGFTGSALDRAAFLLTLAVVPVLWRLDRSFGLWLLFLALVPALSGTFTSFIRYSACAFPLFLGLAVLLGTPARRWPRRLLLVGFAGLQIWLTWRFVHCRWVA